MATNRRWVARATLGLVVALASVITACQRDEPDPPPPPPPPDPPTATVSAPTPVVADNGPKNASIQARVKAELDGKDPAGAAGSPLAAAGTKVTFTAASGWKTSSAGGASLASEPGNKGGVAVASYTASADEGRDAAVKALGLADCQWNPAESVALGKDKLPASASDGLCKKGGADHPAAMVSLSGAGTNVVAVGGWPATGGDDKAVFETLRTAKQVTGGGGAPGGIAACCAAIRQNSKSAPPDQQPIYQAAIAACAAAQANPAALAGVRSILGGKAPAMCR